jgi:tripartite motif-containing protein 71
MRRSRFYRKLVTGLIMLCLLPVVAACGGEQVQSSPSMITIATPVKTPTAIATTAPALPENSQTASVETTAQYPTAPVASLPTAIPATPTASPEPTLTTNPGPLPDPRTNLTTVWRTDKSQDRLRSLTGLATDSRNNLYLSDSWRKIVRKYDATGRFLYELTDGPQAPFGSPDILATDRQDFLYVLGGEVVNKFDSTGKFIMNFRVQPPGPGPFSGPSGLAVDEQGRIYVLDEVGRVYQYDSAGHYLATWGNLPGQPNPELNNAPGKLGRPVGLAADWQGHLYIGDFDNHRVQKFDLKGKFLLSFGTAGSGNGQFGRYNGSNGLTVDQAGNIYVTDIANQRVQKFDSKGHFLAVIGSGPGHGDGQFKLPLAVAVDRAGNLYVADTGNERVQKFSPGGQLLYKIGRQNLGEGQLNNPSGLAVDGQANVYVGDSATRYIQQFDRDGHFIKQWLVESKFPLDPDSDTTFQIGADPTGLIYVADRADNLIKKYDNSGQLVLSWGGTGQKEGQFNRPSSPFVDSQGNIYIADTGNARIQEFDNQGKFLWQLNLPDDIPYTPGSNGRAIPTAVVVDRQDNLYITSLSCSCLKKYARIGRLLLEWGQPPQGQNGMDGQFTGPDGLALDGAGKVYVMDMQNFHCTNCRVQKFDSGGHLLKAWNSLFEPSPMTPPPVPANGQFAVISAMTVDQAGNIYLAEPGYGRIQKLHQAG